MYAIMASFPAEPTKIGGQISTRPDRIVRPVTRINGKRITFRDLAKFAWPQNTDQWLSSVTGYDARTCRRWIAEDAAKGTEPPAEALGVILCEIMRRFHVGKQE